MKALSILQPWAFLIVRPDLEDAAARSAALEQGLIKDVENRRWPTRFRGRFLVHAGKKWGREQEDDMDLVRELFPEILLPPTSMMQRGGFVGAATLVDGRNESDSRWFFGPVDFCLRNQTPLPFAPYKGALGFFNVPDTEPSAMAAAEGA